MPAHPPAIDRMLGHRAPLLWLVLPLMGGLAAARSLNATLYQLPLAGGLVAACLAVWGAWKAERLWAPALAAAMIWAGAAGYGLHRPPLPESGPRARAARRAARLTLRLDRVPPPPEGAKNVSGMATVLAGDAVGRSWVGRRGYFSIAWNRKRPPVASEVLSVEGNLSAVRRGAPAASFSGYLDGMGLDFRLRGGSVLSEERPPTAYRLFCERLAGRMSALLGLGLERRPNLATAYRAMMLGRRHDLSPEDKRLFLRAGAMHLFAINGVHIGVVALALQAVLALARCPRQIAWILTLPVLWIDVDSTGASPSAVRAFLMAACLAAAVLFRRPGNAVAALTASALAILLADPLAFFSASFQMSYGVVAAICLLGLPLGARLRRRFPPYPDLPRTLWEGPIPAGVRWGARDRFLHRFRRARGWGQRHLLSALGIGAAAALSSALSGVEFFRLAAPDGLVANLALVPPASLAIAAGFLSIVFGLGGITALSRLFNAAAGLLLALVEALMRLLTEAPGSSFAAQFRAGWIGPAAQAAFLGTCLAGYGWGWRRARGGFLAPFAVVAIALGFGVVVGG